MGDFRLSIVAIRTSPSEGGIQNCGFLLSDAFSAIQGIKVTLTAEKGSECSDKVRIRYVPYAGARNFLFVPLLIFRLLAQRRPDMHFATHWVCGMACSIDRRIRHVPYALMVHGNEVMPYPKKSIAAAWKNSIRSRVLRDASVVFANSVPIRDMVLRDHPDIDLHVVHPPIDYAPARLPIRRERSYILFSIGRIIERKGFQDVIRAIALLKDQYPQIKYHLAGSGPYLKALKQLVLDLGVEQQVVFLGKISEQEKKRQYQACDLFLMTSHEDTTAMEIEGFGICYLEACMYGKWSIACNTGGVSDAVLDGITGTLIESADYHRISTAVREFYEHIVVDEHALMKWAIQHDKGVIARSYCDVLRSVRLIDP